METTRLPTLPSTEIFAQRIARNFTSMPPMDRARILALSGDLGAGKTTFVKFLAMALGVKETVQSPTFVLMRSYVTQARWPKRILHIDAYRLEGFDALRPLGWEREILDPETRIVLEWPDCVAPLIPIPDMSIAFSVTDDGGREVTVSHQKTDSWA
jgi:tRNA threonylcarbamoyladenosine biosynthesis protein TsaE